MTNAQLFPYPPKFNLRLNENLIASDAIPNIAIKQVIWRNLLGSDNREITKISLLNSVKFATYIEKTREEFKKSHNDLRKFPKMNDKDWE